MFKPTSSIAYTSDNHVSLSYALKIPARGWEKGQEITNKVSLVSGKTLMENTYYKRTADNDGGTRHVNDPDAQVFDWLSNEVLTGFRWTLADYELRTKNVTGEVRFYSTQGPCRSCRGVISQFKTEFPNVKVFIKYDAPDASPTKPGLGGGVYGYEKAKKEGGYWVIEL